MVFALVGCTSLAEIPRVEARTIEIEGGLKDLPLIYAGQGKTSDLVELDLTDSIAVSPGDPKYYHTEWDTFDTLEPLSIENTIRVVLKTIVALVDEE